MEELASHEPAHMKGFTAEDRLAAEILVQHLFGNEGHYIDGLEYAVTYQLAAGHVGGDVVDVFHFDNGSVMFSIADVSGKGAQAAIHAALIKFGLRCYASEGLTPERALRSLDRVFIENNAFERTEQFASVFFGIIDDSRRSLTYASAGHEPVILVKPSGEIVAIAPTAPLVGVFDDQHHLFRQQQLSLEAGSLILATTDGITEARSLDGTFFGMSRLIDTIAPHTHLSMNEQLRLLMSTVNGFTSGHLHDDVAAFVLRIL